MQDDEFPWERDDPAETQSASQALAAALGAQQDRGREGSTPAPAADVVMTPRSVDPPLIH